jgi:integrase
MKGGSKMNNMQSATRLSTLIAVYLTVHKGKKITGSTADLTNLAFNWLIDFAGDMKANDLTAEDAELFQSYLVDAGLSKTSANIYVRAISPVCNWAVFKRYAKENPFAGLKKYKVTRRAVNVYTADEIERMLAVSDDLWKCRILLGLTSLRKGEVLNLTVNDIDFERQLVRIRPKKETGYLWPWEPKDHEIRDLPLLPAVSVLLARRLEQLPSGMPYLMIRPRRYAYMMDRKKSLSERQRKVPDTNFDRNFRALLKRAMVHGTFHQLRKTALTQLTDGLRLQEVQEIAGHSSIETTRHYLASRPDVLTRALDILNRSVTT